jgi:trigger factor
MQVSVESTGALERTMRVDIPEERIEGEVKTRLQSLTKNARIDGFRQGKVPVKIVQQRYGQQVRLEVMGEVMRESYFEALRAEELQPAGEPKIEQDNDQESGLSFTAIFEVYPEVTINDVAALNISAPSCQLDDADVDKMVETLREQQSEFKAVDRTAQMGDQLTLDFDGFVDGEAFEGGKAENFTIKLGSNRLITGFEEGLVDHKAGDSVSLDLAFPDPYHNEELAGKPVRFDIQVKEVAEPELPELNEEFFKRFGIEEGGVDEFKTSIRENMQRESEQRVKAKAKTNVLNALFDANPIELPNTMVQAEAKQLMESAKQRMVGQGMPADQLDGMNHSVFEDEAKRRVALGLLISEIIKQNEMKADPADVRAMVENIAANYQDTASVVQYYYGDESRLAEVQSMVLEQQVVDWVLDKATVTPESLSFDALMNPQSEE